MFHENMWIELKAQAKPFISYLSILLQVYDLKKMYHLAHMSRKGKKKKKTMTWLSRRHNVREIELEETELYVARIILKHTVCGSINALQSEQQCELLL